MGETVLKKFFCFVITALVIALSLCGCTPTSETDVNPLINPNADENAQTLMRYLQSVYGKYILSGQYVNMYEDFDLPAFHEDEDDPESPRTVFKANELQAVYSVTGEYPAILGLDIAGIECGDRCFSVEQAEEWHNAGGIVTITWHWRVDNFDGKPRMFYTEYTDFNLAAALADKESEQYKGLLKDIDVVSEALKPLAEAGVPILWRPLHEASGGWFWWGATGADAYKELWDLLYDRMTNVHKLNNLIWINNSQSADWYVGDDKCDLISDDPYYNSRTKYTLNPGNTSRFRITSEISPKKIVLMSEIDYVPDVDSAFDKGATWLGFATWCRDYVCVTEIADDGISVITYPEYCGNYTTAEELKAAYDNDRTITLSKLKASGEYKTK